MTYSHLWADCLYCTPGSSPGPTLGNEYGRTLRFFNYNRNEDILKHKQVQEDAPHICSSNFYWVEPCSQQCPVIIHTTLTPATLSQPIVRRDSRGKPSASHWHCTEQDSCLESGWLWTSEARYHAWRDQPLNTDYTWPWHGWLFCPSSQR